MDLIRPATDNLYKFAATSGIVLVALGVVTWFQGGERIRQNLYQVQSDAAVANVDLDRWTGQRALIQQHHDSQEARMQMALKRFLAFLKNATALPKEESDRRVSDVQARLDHAGIWGLSELRVIIENTYRELGKELPALDRQFFQDMNQENADLAAEHEKFIDLSAAVDKQKALVEVKENYSRELQNMYLWTKWWCGIMCVVGMSFASVGFYAWWHRFQRLQDRLLEAELRESQSKSNDT